MIWRCNVGQCQINIETMFCMSRLTLNHIESSLSISTMIWTLHNVKTMLLFLTSSFTALINVEKTLNTTIFKMLKRAKKYFWALKKKKRWLLDNTCFWLWLIKKKGKYGMYNIKVNFGKYNAWYTKRIWI